MSSNLMAFRVEFVGQDNQDYCLDFPNLTKAQEEARSLSEIGCHMISVFDKEGADYPY